MVGENIGGSIGGHPLTAAASAVVGAALGASAYAVWTRRAQQTKEGQRHGGE